MNNLFSSNQHGFRQKRSITYPTNTFINNIMIDRLYSKHPIAVVLDIPMYLMQHGAHPYYSVLPLGITGNICSYIKNCLTNCTFRVQINNTYSTITPPKVHLKVVGVLCPTLFNLASCDLDTTSHNSTQITIPLSTMQRSDLRRHLQKILKSWTDTKGLDRALEKQQK